MVIQRLNKIRGGDESGRRNTTFTGWENPTYFALNIHIRFDVGAGDRDRHLVEGGHGCRVTGQYGGVVGDSRFTGIGAAQTGGRVFVQLERGGEGLSAGQGDGRGDQAFLEKGSCHSVLSL